MAYNPPPHTTQHWSVTKPAATGRRGMVVSQSRDAALAGVAILDAGGNAVDAAVATALALATVEPWNSGLGGIGFALVHRAGQKQAETVDFGPVAPAGLKPDAFRLTGRMKQDLFPWPEVEGDANIHGPLSFAIPSAVAGYAHMHERWGVLPLADVMAPAIALARRGLSQDWFTTLKIANSASVLQRYAESAAIYLPGGLPPVPPYQGQSGYFPQGRLAATLERLAHAGLRDFYEGDIAQSLASDFAALGSLLTADDLHHCQARMLPATTVSWQGRTIQLPTGLTAGPTFARVLEAMRDVPVGATPDAAWFAALARSMKSAYAERLSGLGESEPKAAESCTTHLTVCDEAGTMVAMTTTLLSSMGSRVVLPQSGVLMNNGVMWFDPRPGQPNSASPGKRPLTNMCPVIVAEGDAPVIAAGASGGRRIMAAVAQMLAFTLDFGMDPAAAAHHPRIDVSDPGFVNADQRLPSDVIAALQADGAVNVVEHGVMPVNFACPNLITQHGGQRTGISDVMSPWSAAIAQA
jgi:gamma-glutamyltranspeptidase/glutathione hydrolase